MSEEEESQRLKDTVTVLEGQVRELRRLEAMDLKIEIRNAIDKMQTAVLQFERALGLLGGMNERRAKDDQNQGSSVQFKSSNSMPKGRSTRGQDTESVPQMQESAGVQGLRTTED